MIPAAAFGRIPQSYDSACFAILIANGKSGADLVNDCRALGAPLLEIQNNALLFGELDESRTPLLSIDTFFRRT